MTLERGRGGLALRRSAAPVRLFLAFLFWLLLFLAFVFLAGLLFASLLFASLFSRLRPLPARPAHSALGRT